MFIQCTECNKRMSDRAPRCPFCGAAAPGSTNEQRRLDRRPADTAGNTVTSICDHTAVAKEAVEALADEGVKLDHSLASLAAVDQYLRDAFGEGGRAPGAERWAPTPDDRKLIAMVGSYLGEVLRLRIGGDWSDDPDRAGMPLYVRLRLPSGATILPLERAYRRLKDGDAMSLDGFATDLRRQLGDDHPRPEDGMDWANQATDYIRSERFDVALQFLRRAVETDDSLCEGWFCRGFVEERLARPHDALRSYDRAQQLSPPDDRAFLQHVKAQIQRLNADLGGFRHATGELKAFVRRDTGRKPVVPETDLPADEAGSLDVLRNDDGTSESSVVKRINEARSAAADTAAPGGESAGGIASAAAAVQRRDAPGSPDTFDTLQPSGDAFAATLHGDTDAPAAVAAPPFGGLRLDESNLPDLDSPDLFSGPSERTTLTPSALKVEDIQSRLRNDILRADTPPATDAVEGSLDEALSLAGAGRLEEAAQHAAAVRLRTTEANDLLQIARILCAAERSADALEAVRKGLERDNGDPELHRLHAGILLAQDLPEEAVGAATAALARWADAGWAWYLHGRAHFAADQFDEAVRSLERALGLDPSLTEAWRLRGHAELECGRLEEARRAFRAYLALADLADAASAKEVRRQLGKLELAR